jgi:F-type H+-transporting ATPase subunit delta
MDHTVQPIVGERVANECAEAGEAGLATPGFQAAIENVTVARELPAREKDALGKQLSRLFGKRVVPHVSLNPAILGGVIVKVGDTVMDGSVRRRLASLKQGMLATATR